MGVEENSEMIYRDLLCTKDAGIQVFHLGQMELSVRYDGESQFKLTPMFQEEERVKNPEGDERLAPIQLNIGGPVDQEQLIENQRLGLSDDYILEHEEVKLNPVTG